MAPESRRLAGILLVVLPTVEFGGVSILSLLIDDPRYTENKLRQDLWRAGHAHAGVLLILSLVALRYVDEANLRESCDAANFRFSCQAPSSFPCFLRMPPWSSR
jgi:hypothetical protein